MGAQDPALSDDIETPEFRNYAMVRLRNVSVLKYSQSKEAPLARYNAPDRAVATAQAADLRTTGP